MTHHLYVVLCQNHYFYTVLFTCMTLSAKDREREIQFSRKEGQQMGNDKDLTEVEHPVLLDEVGHVKVNDC